MAQHIEQVFPSTTFAWKQVKIGRRPGPQVTVRAKRARRAPDSGERSDPPRSYRLPATLVVKWRGGDECWWQITYAGRVYNVRGAVQVHDVLWQIVNGQ